jgi:hypothetical protein
MCLTIDQWIQIATAAGTWVAGVGTIAAVVVALRLARRAWEIRLKAFVYISIRDAGGASTKQVACFNITNLGEHPV